MSEIDYTSMPSIFTKYYYVLPCLKLVIFLYYYFCKRNFKIKTDDIWSVARWWETSQIKGIGPKINTQGENKCFWKDFMLGHKFP